jgi:hypothetical protein
MKSQALQELVKKIFSDEKTKQQFMSNPESVLSKYSLTEQEKRAVLSAHTKIGLVTSDSPQLEAAIKPNITWWAPSP